MKFSCLGSKSELKKKTYMHNKVTSWGIAVLKIVQMIGESFSESLKQKIKQKTDNHVLKVWDSTACNGMFQFLMCWPFTPYHQRAYSLNYSLDISYGTDEENLFKNQELL